MPVDPLRYYDLERYLFEDVHAHFHAEGSLSAFDLFSIVIWKANRAKSKVAKKLQRVAGTQCLETATRQLTAGIAAASGPRERLEHLFVRWQMPLPMASAILTVLYPDTFTVYDRRACAEVHAFEKLAHQTRFDAVWQGYSQFVVAVRAEVPGDLSLRDKDRHLFGKSLVEQLETDLTTCFARRADRASS